MSLVHTARKFCTKLQEQLSKEADDSELLERCLLSIPFGSSRHTREPAAAGSLVAHLAECAVCHGTLDGMTGSLLARRRERTLRLLLDRQPAAMVSMLAQTRPLDDGRHVHWPEVDALVSWLGAMSQQESETELGLLLRDVLLVPKVRQAPEWVTSFRAYLRTRMAARSDAPRILARAFLSDDPRIDFGELEESLSVSLEDEEVFPARQAEAAFERACWESAVHVVSALRPRDTTKFREKVTAILHDYLSDDLMRKVVTPLEAKGWDVSIYRPDISGSVLEVVAASDATSVFTVRHPIQSKTPDIEVDVFKRRRAERLLGHDARYNDFIYKRYNHARFKDRLFIPLILARRRGNTSFFAPCEWKADGNRAWVPALAGGSCQVVGNLSVSREEQVGPEEIQDVLDLASTVAADAVHRTSLTGLCDRLLFELMREFGASHGALHVAPNIDAVFEPEHPAAVRADAGGIAHPPRRGGIGAHALANGYAHFQGETLALENPRLAAQNVRATSAAPVRYGQADPIGLAYLHFDRADGGADFRAFAEIIGWAASIALHVMQQQLERAHILTEAKGFASPMHESSADRLSRMAEFAHNLLGCDHVSIVTTLGEPQLAHAGRFLHKRKARASLAALDRLKYACVRDVSILEGETLATDPRGDFVRVEEIKTVVMRPLEDRLGEVGLLVLDYRRPYDPVPDQGWLQHLTMLFGAGARATLLDGEGNANALEEAATHYREFQLAFPVLQSADAAARCGFQNGVRVGSLGSA